ncbi:hypothetical protein DY000_02007780 [Brassica cretica]|uniref:Uncharacterized protein n=1 Tax=Brassica cretica TaxID=69181 RepID=A0ABQ7C9D3_BRACR|nr:hypothetical protein DY000_02007780 [Brassica cretica]
MHVRTTVSGSTSQEENNELMALSLDLLDEKREAARLRNWKNLRVPPYPLGSNQRSQGLRKNPRVPMWPQGSKDKKEARTPVQPKAHRGHNKLQRTYGFQSAISGSKPPDSYTASRA